MPRYSARPGLRAPRRDPQELDRRGARPHLAALVLPAGLPAWPDGLPAAARDLPRGARHHRGPRQTGPAAPFTFKA